MSGLTFNGMPVAPELAKKLFEHYPKLEMQLDVLVHVTREMESLIERTNAIFSESGSTIASVPSVSGAIERAKEVAVSTSIPVSVQPPPAPPTPPAPPLSVPEICGNILDASDRYMRRYWRRR